MSRRESVAAVAREIVHRTEIPSIPEHVFVDAKGLCCSKCGRRAPLFPVKSSDVAAKLDAFAAEHATCETRFTRVLFVGQCACPPSINRMSRRSHFAETEWKKRVFYALEQQRLASVGQVPPITAPAKRSILLTRFIPKGGRRFDEDNLAAAFKPVLDALKRPIGRAKRGLSLIWDDSREWVDVRREQKKVDRTKLGRKDYGDVHVLVSEEVETP